MRPFDHWKLGLKWPGESRATGLDLVQKIRSGWSLQEVSAPGSERGQSRPSTHLKA
jgi:hypothetical protein